MRVCQIVSLLLLACMFSLIFLTEPFGRCDPSMPKFPLKGVDVEGAHIVSAGAYFRFWIFNSLNFSITVELCSSNSTLLYNDTTIRPNSSVEFDVIAPQVSGTYKQVTYVFYFISGVFDELDYTVLVLNPVFVQIFPLLVPILILVIAVVLTIVGVVIIRRRRSKTKPKNQQSTSQ